MDINGLLGDLVSESFKNLPEEKFLAKVEDEVMPAEELVVIRRFYAKLPKQGRAEVFVFGNGYVAVCSSKGMWSLYETQARLDERRYIREWNDHIRGTFTDRIPTAPGVYPCRDRDLGKRTFREFVMHQGRLLDVSGGLVPPGAVTTFRGQFWTSALPNHRSSY